MIVHKVIGGSKTADSSITGSYDQNLLLNTLSYNVQFPDGALHDHGAKIIDEKYIYLQVDENGHSHNVLEAIVDHHKGDDAIDVEQKYDMTKSDQKQLRKSTVGWDL